MRRSCGRFRCWEMLWLFRASLVLVKFVSINYLGIILKVHSECMKGSVPTSLSEIMFSNFARINKPDLVPGTATRVLWLR
jgi:hypothetical protein